MSILHWVEDPDPTMTEDEQVWGYTDDEGTVLGVVYVPLYCDGDGRSSGACHTWRGDEPCQSQGKPFLTWLVVQGVWDDGPRYAAFEDARTYVETMLAVKS